MAIKQMDWSYIDHRVRIYRNLNNGRMSIQVKLGIWRVVGHVLNVVLQDVNFYVSEAGRQRVMKERCKNVHAWGEGILIGEFAPDVETLIDLAYNPYENATFIQRGTANPIYRCNFLVVSENRVYVTQDAVGDMGKQADSRITASKRLTLVHSGSSTIDLCFAA